MQGLVAFTFIQFRHRNARPSGYDARDLFVCHRLVDKGQILRLHLLFLFFQLFLQLGQSAVLQLRRLVQVVLPLGFLDLFIDLLDLLTDLLDPFYGLLFIFPLDFLVGILLFQVRQFFLQMLQTLFAKPVFFFFQRRLLNLHLHDFAPQLVKLRRHRIQFRLNERARLIHQVDGLVRQEPVGNVPVGQGSRRHQRAVCDLHPVEHFIALLQATQDGDGVLHRRFIHHDRLETAFQRRIFLDVLPVLIQRRGADTVQLASGQHRLEHIAGVHGAVRLACAHDGMELIDEQNDPAIAVLHFLQDRFQTFLELAPVLRAGHQRAHIKGEDSLLFQALRHIAADDPLRQSFHHCGLADARFADEDRVVLRLTGKDADHIADLLIAADDRIELLIPGALHQILSVFIQRIVSRFRIVTGHPLVPAHRRKRVQESLAADAELPEELLHIFTCIF